MNLGEHAKSTGGDFLKAVDFAGKNVPVSLTTLELIDLPRIGSSTGEREEKVAASFDGKEGRVLCNKEMLAVLIGIDKKLEDLEPVVGEPVDVGPMSLVLYTRKFTMDGAQKDMFCFRDANQALDDSEEF